MSGDVGQPYPLRIHHHSSDVELRDRFAMAALTGLMMRTEADLKARKERRCKRCGHPDHWHRVDDSQDADMPDWKFRCLGWDCEGPGFAAGTPESRCGCPDFVPPVEADQ